MHKYKYKICLQVYNLQLIKQAHTHTHIHDTLLYIYSIIITAMLEECAAAAAFTTTQSHATTMHSKTNINAKHTKLCYEY